MGICLLSALTLKAPITTKVVCFSHLLKCLRSLYDKQCGPRSDCSYRSSLIWSTLFTSILKFVSNVMQLFAADDFSRRHFSDSFFLGPLMVNCLQACRWLHPPWTSAPKQSYSWCDTSFTLLILHISKVGKHPVMTEKMLTGIWSIKTDKNI